MWPQVVVTSGAITTIFIVEIKSVGAPPDPLGPLGQVWGLSPMSPRSLKKAAYRPMINLYRRNMRDCGAMRINHAAGLFRFW